MTTSKTPGGHKIVVEGLGRLPYFSHASIVGDLIFVSGTLGTLSREAAAHSRAAAAHSREAAARSGLALVPGGVGPETRQTLENIRTILREAGADLEDVAKVSVYVTDMADFPAMNEAYAEFFPPSAGPPARITLAVAELALGAAVEIECVATRGLASGS